MIYRIKDSELLETMSIIDLKQQCASILKERGAPIEGTLILDVKPGYLMCSWRDEETNETVFTFKETKIR